MADQVRETVIAYALRYSGWGHRKIWALASRDGHRVSASTVLRILRSEDLVLPQKYQKQCRQNAAARKEVFHAAPTGPNQVWQLDFTEYETITGGVWRIAACRDYYSKYEYPAHLSPSATKQDAIAAVKAAIVEAELQLGTPLVSLATATKDGTLQPVVTIVTDNGGPFKSFDFQAFIASTPELAHVRTRARSPQQNGSRERGFGTLKYEWLYRHEIADSLELADHLTAWRQEYNTIRPHEALNWATPAEIHTQKPPKTLPIS